jgi:hypothetical protein
MTADDTKAARRRSGRRVLGGSRLGGAGACVLAAGVVIVVATAAQQGTPGGPAASGAQALAGGERMYRKGILPSGDTMRAVTPDGAAARGTTFACASCHTRSGLGSMGEGQRTPPVNGPNLFRPLYPYYPSLSDSERKELLPARFQTPPRRPAYTNETLSTAIRKGTDPSGRSFSAVMPRYVLGDRDMATLIRYLKGLSSRPSPGVTETTLALATVVTDDVAPADRDDMLRALDRAIQSHNNLRPGGGFMSTMISMQVMGLGFRQLTLARWLLTGPSETWRVQLEKYYGSQPVFAVVGGLSNRKWTPIHRFCEEHQIPCILPITDLPEISETDYYTLYFSKGVYHEGEAVARYLIETLDRAGPRDVVQVLGPGSEANALAAGFRDAWAGAGGPPIRTVSAETNQPLTGEALARLVPPGKNSALLLWTGPEAYGALRALATAPSRPAVIVMSSTLLAGSLWDLPSEARPFTYVAYPFREPGERRVPGKMGGAPAVVNREYRRNDRRIAARTETLVALLMGTLTRMERNYYRDHLLDLIDMLPADGRTDYELLDYGPGQRYLSEGCYIMRLSEGADPVLIRISEWNGSGLLPLPPCD